MARNIIDAYDLREAYYEKNPRGHFFDHDTLKFFGERFSEMYLWKGTFKKSDVSGKEHECYILSSVQRPPYGRKHRVYHYFDVDTLCDIIM